MGHHSVHTDKLDTFSEHEHVRTLGVYSEYRDTNMERDMYDEKFLLLKAYLTKLFAGPEKGKEKLAKVKVSNRVEETHDGKRESSGSACGVRSPDVAV